MPRADMQKYQAIDEQQVIQASAVDPKSVTPSAPLITDFTIISSETPQPTRQNFISRVYIILWFQLLVTSTFIGLCNQNKSVQKFMVSQAGISIMWLSMICILIMSCCLMCLSSSIRKCPGSGMYLTLFTGCMSYIMGYIGIAYKLTTLLLAGLSTLGIFSGLTLYAVQTKYDYTEMGGYLISCLLGFILFGFMATFIHSSTISIIYSSAGSMLFSFYIVYDTQLIVGGNHRKIMFHIDDYVLAAVSLYLDVINLFLYLLDLISGGSPRN